MTRIIQGLFPAFALLLACPQASATWYDYAFAETSALTDLLGNPVNKADGTPYPNLPEGLTKATMAIDSSGNLYSAYYLEREKTQVNTDLTTTTALVPYLTWVKWSKNTWKEKTATLEIENVTNPQVAVDSMGNAFLFYLNKGNLEYAIWSDENDSFDPTRSNISTNDFVARVHYDTLAERPKIQVTYLSKGIIRHAYIDPETDQEDDVEVKDGVNTSLSLALDVNGNPHILYHDAGEDANRNGTLDDGEDINENGDLDLGTRSLKYALGDAASKTFIRYALASNHEAGAYSYLAFDANSNLHACYYDAKHLELRYIKRTAAGVWQAAETVDNNWVNGGLNFMATDANGHIHISYLGYYGYNVKYATNRTGSWTNEIIQTTKDDNHFLGTAVTADKDGEPHIVTIENEINYIHYITTTTSKVPEVDSDNDGSSDLQEKLLDTDPYNPDSDNDGLTDGEEASIPTDPNDIDSDNDGLTDAKEEKLGLNPNGANTDEDIAQALDSHRGYPRRTFQTSPYTSGWFYTSDMGWLYTAPDSFPYIYKPNEAVWLFFQEGTSSPRWFFNTSRGLWEQR